MFTVLNVTDDLTHCGHIGHTVSDFRRMCALATQYGFQGVNIDFNADTGIALAEKGAILLDHGLKAVAFGLPLQLYSEHDEARFVASLKVFEEHAQAARKLGCGIVIAYLPPYSQELRFDDYFRLMVDRLVRAAPILRDYGLQLAFEFIGPVETRLSSRYDFIHTIDGVRCLIAAAGLYGHAGFKLDAHHWQFSGAGRLDLQHLDPEYLLYVELNDGLPGHGMFDMPEFRRELPLATGVTDIAGFMQGLRQKGYAGPVAIEPWSQRLRDMPVEEAVATVKAAFDQCMALPASTTPNRGE